MSLSHVAFLQTAVIRHVVRSDCFVTIPHRWKQVQDKVLQLTCASSGRSVCVSAAGFNKEHNVIEIGSIFASRNNMPDGEQVAITAVEAVPASDVYLSTVISEDETIVHQNKRIFEWLMTQIIIVNKDLVIPVATGSGSVVSVRVSDTRPDRTCVRLQQNTNLHFANPSSGVLETSRNTVLSFLSSFTSKSSKEPMAVSSHEAVIPVFPSSRKPLLLRGDDNWNIRKNILNKFKYQNCVFISDREETGVTAGNFVARISLCLPFSTRSSIIPKKEDSSQESPDTTQFLTTIVSVFVTSLCLPGHVVPCDSLIRQMGIRKDDRVVISHPDGQSSPEVNVGKVRVPVVRELVIRPLTSSNYFSETLLSHILEEEEDAGVSQITLTDNTLLTIRTHDFFVKTSSPMIVLRPADLVNVSVGDVIFEASRIRFGKIFPLHSVSEVGFSTSFEATTESTEADIFQQQKSQLRSFIENEKHCITKDSQFLSTILITGPKGSGKRSLIESALKTMKHMFVKTIDCKLLRGKRLDSFQKLILREINDAVFYKPSVVIFEDLEHVLSSQEDDNPVEAFHNCRCSLIFDEIIKMLRSLAENFHVKVTVIVTAKSEGLFHPVIKDKFSFSHYIEMPVPSKDERATLIRYFCRTSGDANAAQESLRLSDSLVEEISKQTEGFIPSDLRMFMDQCLHLQISGAISKDSDVMNALSKFRPVSLRSIRLGSRSKKQLRDVGGMIQAKKVMHDTIMIPLKYPILFQKFELRPQSCILLYGAPGTGKTLLAEAIANECKVNFLLVEGPELLSKYIGASEQAVRDLFQRAKAAKPCIIFFDEFDAIAPRRGHDNTGVTDRVVNQLLTEMDGVEGLERGIFILAATSRPELLDPALLRPGRFDKHLKCDLPDLQERREILEIICRDVLLDADVDLDIVAERTQWYSGADLQSVIFSAQVDAVQTYLIGSGAGDVYEDPQVSDPQQQHSSPVPCLGSAFTEKEVAIFLDNISLDNEVPETSTSSKTTKVQPKITMNQILEAIGKVPCSVSGSERQKYESIYKDFESGRRTGTEQRVTLA